MFSTATSVSVVWSLVAWCSGWFVLIPQQLSAKCGRPTNQGRRASHLPFWPLLQYAVVLHLLLLVRSFLWACGMCSIVNSYLLRFLTITILFSFLLQNLCLGSSSSEMCDFCVDLKEKCPLHLQIYAPLGRDEEDICFDDRIARCFGHLEFHEVFSECDE